LLPLENGYASGHERKASSGLPELLALLPATTAPRPTHTRAQRAQGPEKGFGAVSRIGCSNSAHERLARSSWLDLQPAALLSARTAPHLARTSAQLAQAPETDSSAVSRDGCSPSAPRRAPASSAAALLSASKAPRPMRTSAELNYGQTPVRSLKVAADPAHKSAQRDQAGVSSWCCALAQPELNALGAAPGTLGEEPCWQTGWQAPCVSSGSLSSWAV